MELVEFLGTSRRSVKHTLINGIRYRVVDEFGKDKTVWVLLEEHRQ